MVAGSRLRNCCDSVRSRTGSAPVMALAAVSATVKSWWSWVAGMGPTWEVGDHDAGAGLVEAVGDVQDGGVAHVVGVGFERGPEDGDGR